MLFEFVPAQLISDGTRPGKAARFPVVSRDNVVVKEAHTLHLARLLALIFQHAYLESHGWPHALENLPVVSSE